VGFVVGEAVAVGDEYGGTVWIGFGVTGGAGVEVAISVGIGVWVGAGDAVGVEVWVGAGVGVGVAVDVGEETSALLETTTFEIFQWMSDWWPHVTSKTICPIWLRLHPSLLKSTV
jgi:hypothetical protein